MTRHARILVSGDPSAVAVARDRVLAHIRAWGVPLDEDMRDAVKLVASELITNAVVHGSGFTTVGVYLGDGRLILVVHDGNQAEPRREYATGDAEAGRGLALVESLATSNGWEPTARGKKVWAEFEVPSPSPTARGEVLRRSIKTTAPRAYVNLMPTSSAKAAGVTSLPVRVSSVTNTEGEQR